MSASTKFSKEIAPLKQGFPTYECDVKNDPIGLEDAESNKKIRLRLLVLLGIRFRLRNPAFNVRGQQKLVADDQECAGKGKSILRIHCEHCLQQ